MGRQRQLACSIAQSSELKQLDSRLEASSLEDIIARFLIGGLVVSAFSLIADLFKPKTFAGLFGAAPSVALASLGLVVAKQGKEIAITEARSMIIGAIALVLYTATVSYVLLRFKGSTLTLTLSLLPLWLGVAVGFWYVILS